ncbi:MAG: aminoacyl-histidine dipeptidase [Lachnospiraceae bacterium]|nr:aminoacyl-histidine dipeptidase [Lachnospiraceae bacterium]
MGVLTNLQPERVFYYFEEISKIPHGSGNIRQMSDYLAAFAREQGLTYIQDTAGNVIICKPATKGYEQEPALILQGHMDMVAVQTPDSTKDMLTEGLDLAVDGDFIYAENTTLGGDDGIAVAYALAILESREIKHPKLEVIITVDEEIGLLGAGVIDLSMLEGHRMINLDSEEEGIFWTSCAGGAGADCMLPVEREHATGLAVEIIVDGLQGGHSGCEIHKEHGNANCLMARALYNVIRGLDLQMVELSGGVADNAIPRLTKAMVLVEPEKVQQLQEKLLQEEQQIKGELGAKDPDFKLEVRVLEQGDYEVLNVRTTLLVLSFLMALPNGVLAMSGDVPGLVETSLNMGVLKLEEQLLHAQFSVRSSVESAKDALIAKLQAIVELAGGRLVISGAYPGWKYRVDSPLRDKMIRVYEEMYGTRPKVEAIHAGLECGILGSKIADLDCISLGPDMYNVHTTEERLSISSTAKVWNYLIRLLEEKDHV